MRIWRAGLVIVAAVVLAGCMTLGPTKYMRSVVGQHYSQVIADWGPPQGIFDAGDGGRVLVWTRTRTTRIPGQARSTVTAQQVGDMVFISGHQRYTPDVVLTQTAHRTFWVNAEGRILRWQWRGL